MKLILHKLNLTTFVYHVQLVFVMFVVALTPGALSYSIFIFSHLKLGLSTAIHNFK